VTTTAAVENRGPGYGRFWRVRRWEIRIDKTWERLVDGEIGLSVEDGKKVTTALHRAAASQEADNLHALSTDLS
jgi:hypothetical protein